MTASEATATPDTGAPDGFEAARLQDARLMSQAYDGIREYDNPLPGWWSAIFIGSIVFAVFYGLYFHVVRWGKTDDQSYQASLGEYEGKKALRDKAEAANVSEKSLAAATDNPAMVTKGAELFKLRCVSCHADGGKGLIGPNLTDSVQKHGSSRMDIYATIQKGVPGPASLAGGEQRPPTDVRAVATFVTSLRGTNAPNGKAPEGQPVEKF